MVFTVALPFSLFLSLAIVTGHDEEVISICVTISV